ncbi:MAG TPA: CHRD domain-containing protein [Albitalea sp.]|nr:CHRD domain-containing protein [Albitalea sp.]
MTASLRPSRLAALAAAFALIALSACSNMSNAAGGGTLKLSGDQEVPPVATSASGQGTITVAPDGAVSGSVTTSGMDGTMAHIHMAGAGKNGPVIVPLVKSGDGAWSVPAGAKLTPEQMKAYQQGDLYVNVHTEAHKGGEVRAQLHP